MRARELAIRGALGATRWRIVRQMLTESFLIALLGAVVGVALAYWAVDLLAQITSTPQFQLPYWIVFTIDAKVLGFTLGAVLLATFVSGLVPALLAARGNASEMMKEGGRGNSSRLVNVITRDPRGRPDCDDGRASDRLGLASSLDPQPGETGLRLRRQGRLTPRAWVSSKAIIRTEDSRRQFFQRAVRALRTNPAFDGAAMSDRFRMTFG